ncbi:MAG: SBBP repeat-containing protein, partial [Chloroflexota bacterium]|nr:SBBP repeat-containing protein [Chloroflexota bacterium]
GIAVDRFGNAYITGDIPADEPFQTTDGSTHHGGIDTFVIKLSFDGVSTVTIAYSTLIGGSGLDQALGIAVDQGEDIYLGGVTESADFPTLHPYQATYAGNSDGFVVELDPNGVPLYSTYFGGSGFDGIIGVAIGNASGTGNQCVAPCDVYVTGDTTSTDFPSASPLQPNHANCITQAFVARLQLPAGLPFSTTIGGCNGEAIGDAVAVTTAGEIVLAGLTTGSLPLVHPIQGTYAGGNSDAFVLKIGANPTAAVVSRFTTQRIAGRMLFTWRLIARTDVLSFDLYAGTHRLNAHTIPVHASPVYHYRVGAVTHGRYTLHTLLRNGQQIVVAVG